MPHLGHKSDIFVAYMWGCEAREPGHDDRPVIAELLQGLSEECRSLIAGSIGGVNGYYSLALLPSGGNIGDSDSGFHEVYEALVALVGSENVEYVRIQFGADDERVLALDATYPWYVGHEQLLENKPLAGIRSFFDFIGVPMVVHSIPPAPLRKDELRHLSRSARRAMKKDTSTHWVDLGTTIRNFGSGGSEEDAIRSAARRFRIEKGDWGGR